MLNQVDYITIALEDLEDAIDFQNRGRWNKCVRYCEQFVEKAFKQVIFAHEETNELLLTKDKKMLYEHKVHKLAKRTEVILNVEYSKEDLRRFRELENYYFNANYPGANYIAVQEETAAEVLNWTKNFAIRLCGQNIFEPTVSAKICEISQII
ncbi:MAG: HEPN domain-containing protein [Firmicutes bacterium]|nr:HEPN domain-containing protein [Bacillota bacterium]